MPYRYFIQLSFDGSGYCGWQAQPQALTVQSALEDALSVVSGIAGHVTGCGRADTGVSASVFYAHLDVEHPIKNPDRLSFKLNSYLPPSIAIHGIFPVHPGGHARFSAISREYTYLIITRKDPFLASTSYRLPVAPDLQRMNQAALALLDHKDFQCFSKSRSQVKTFLCNISEARWEQQGHKLIFTIRADRFLRNMVRAVAGTLLDVGRGRTSLEEFLSILESRNRSRAGYSVPAKGLTLTDVVYPRELFSDEPEWFDNSDSRNCISMNSHPETDMPSTNLIE